MRKVLMITSWTSFAIRIKRRGIQGQRIEIMEINAKTIEIQKKCSAWEAVQPNMRTNEASNKNNLALRREGT